MTGTAATDAELAARGLTRRDFTMQVGQAAAAFGTAFFNTLVPLGENAEFYSFAGFSSRAELLRELRGATDLPTYRIRFHPAAGPDPRALLAATVTLSDDDITELRLRLARLDRASSHGSWTEDVLRTIAERPGVRAADLAASFGRDTQPFKLDVRKLKNLGLTISLEVGYRLSPRGEAYLAASHAS